MTVEELERFVGLKVAVYAGKGPRNSFETQISIEGKLQQHPKARDSFRVVVNDGIYAYFRANEVSNEIAIAELLGRPNHETKSGCKAVLCITGRAL
jgi:hypothetical protein